MSERSTQRARKPFLEQSTRARAVNPGPPVSHTSEKEAAPEESGRGVQLPCDDKAGRYSVVDTGLDSEHRAGGVKQDALRIGPQDQLADRSTPAQADHDEVRVDLVGHLDQVL